MDSLEIQYWRRALQMIWTTGEMNKWILELIKPETSLEAKMIKLKLFYCRYMVRRQGSLEKTMMRGKNRRQQEKRKMKYEMDRLQCRSHRHVYGAEQSY